MGRTTMPEELLAPATQFRDIDPKVEPVTHPHHEAGNVASEGSTATGAGLSERARFEHVAADTATHGEDEHGGNVA